MIFICLPQAYWPLPTPYLYHKPRVYGLFLSFCLPFQVRRQTLAVSGLFSFTFLPQRLMVLCFSRRITSPSPHLLLTLRTPSLINSFSLGQSLVPKVSFMTMVISCLWAPLEQRGMTLWFVNTRKSKPQSRGCNFISRPILLKHIDIYEKLSPGGLQSLPFLTSQTTNVNLFSVISGDSSPKLQIIFSYVLVSFIIPFLFNQFLRNTFGIMYFT